jgi:hypothetical protein
MNTDLTREQFAELLDACLGAHFHAHWALSHGTHEEYEIAQQAATDSRIELQKAVFG